MTVDLKIFEAAQRINASGKYWCFFWLHPHVGNIDLRITKNPDYEDVLIWRVVNLDGSLARQMLSEEVLDANQVLAELAKYEDV